MISGADERGPQRLQQQPARRDASRSRARWFEESASPDTPIHEANGFMNGDNSADLIAEEERADRERNSEEKGFHGCTTTTERAES